MKPQHHYPAPSGAARRRQRGVYALEWAIIFPVFFMLLYAIISFGLAFLVRESMQFAAEDGARAALQFQPGRQARLNTAKTIAADKLSWLSVQLRPSADSINASICRVGSPEVCSPTLPCSSSATERCMVSLSFTVAYGSAPLVPGLSMLGIHLFNPEQLTASASILVDGGGI
ncbi:pilus assembly protein [Comamonas sp. Y6]|uniref:Pilus assembly protein n=1 Tax=Comamonas resistens TaxID=3046670 RepID=A0ABY8SRB4_9BURK|nr:TadE/TadG family type IV pilus assembly protein [Comamonas resistens]MDL5035906.1 pilus assembly protein [Comamonas resistens]WHS65310.1 pilus assembly protein [Comamonas resistens]